MKPKALMTLTLPLCTMAEVDKMMAACKALDCTGEDLLRKALNLLCDSLQQERQESGSSEKPNNLLSEKQEQPEVDISYEEELKEWMDYGPHTCYPWTSIPDAIEITAEHFYELGLNAREEE